MDPGKLLRSVYVGRFEKRRSGRMSVAGTATADFLVPAGLRITNISRAGVGLSGVVRITTRDTGMVQLYLPGSYELTTALAQVSWSDRQGHVGLKFIQFQTIADEWKPWFAGTSESEPETAQTAEPSPAHDAGILPERSAATAATQPSVAAPKTAVTSGEQEPDYDLRTELAARRPRRVSTIVRRVLRVSLLALLIGATAGAARYWWMRRPTPATTPPAPPVQATRPPAPPKTTRPKPPKFITRVQMTEGEPVLESRSSKAALIQRGKPISRPEPAYPGGVPVQPEEVRLLVTIDQKGTVNEVQIVRGNPAIAREVASAVGHWRYSPFFSNSSPVSVKLPVTIKFEKYRLASPDTE